MSVPRTHSHELPSGLRVVTCLDPWYKTATMRAQVRAGFYYESKRWPGAAQLLGIMLPTRPKGTPDHLQIAAQLHERGVVLQTGVTGQWAEFVTAAVPEDFDSSMGLFGDAICRPQFTAGQVVQQAKAQLSQYMQNLQDSNLLINRILHNELLGEHPYNRDPLGNPEALQKIGGQELRDLHRECYRPNRTYITITGHTGMDTDALLDSISRGFGLMIERGAGGQRPLEIPVNVSMANLLKETEAPGADTALVVLAATLPGQVDRVGLDAMNVIAEMLGLDDENCGLRPRLADEKAIQHINIELEQFPEFSFLLVSAWCPKADMQRVEDLLRRELAEIHRVGMPLERTMRTIASCHKRRLLSNDYPAAAAAQAVFSWEMFDERPETEEELVPLTPQQVAEHLTEYLSPDKIGRWRLVPVPAPASPFPTQHGAKSLS